ncbi:hypothetical protein PoB_000317800 [Plakobranchus ocellatus]|uniref:Uncharacterized protein n=1 Tax=Plakobranchus ocellatus TaxID=259542 RepID=A0AAV3Y338_9GAST|nr:hypothetical protein PoB_000317800 [Plakobranchus ocellatus]
MLQVFGIVAPQEMQTTKTRLRQFPDKNAFSLAQMFINGLNPHSLVAEEAHFVLERNCHRIDGRLDNGQLDQVLRFSEQIIKTINDKT